jgi:RNA polymerase sigma-70 factor (ECF subfamily)
MDAVIASQAVRIVPAMAAAAHGGAEEGEELRLIERARTDRAAFAVLYRGHYAAIGGYLYRRTGDVHATEDLIADTFLSALKALPRYRSGGVPFRAWLYRIATNAANGWARRRRRRPEAPLSAAVGAAAPPGTDSRDDVEALERALRRLAPRFQAVVTLHYVEGLALEEVAAVLGCRLGTVKSRLYRAREALRRALTERRGNA